MREVFHMPKVVHTQDSPKAALEKADAVVDKLRSQHMTKKHQN